MNKPLAHLYYHMLDQLFFAVLVIAFELLVLSFVYSL